MSIISLTLETATSLFMHGADPRRRAELRPPAIKGLMRFWFRALAGGAADLDTVRKIEARVFGSSDAGQGITVRVEGTAPSVDSKRFLLPHKPDYTNNPSQIDKWRSPSPAIIEGKEFKIILFDRPDRDPKLLEAAFWALWLSIHFGGFGQRARRGAGSGALRKIAPPITGLAVPDAFSAPEAVKAHLENGLRTANACFRETFSLDGTDVFYSDPPPFPILAPDVACIQVLELQAREEEAARKEIMTRIAGFKNPAWGLPYGSPTAGETKVMGKRMASPVWFHLIPKQPEGFILVQTMMRSQFPDGIPQPDWEKVGRYFNDSRNKGALRVDLP